MRSVLMLAVLLLAACALPPSDEPAHFNRMARFMGLVAHCGCSDISTERMLLDYPKVVQGHYPEKEISSMRAYVELAVAERQDNLAVICAEVCSQRCMVQSVVEPLGGRRVSETACLVSDRDLHLTDPEQVNLPGGYQ